MDNRQAVADAERADDVAALVVALEAVAAELAADGKYERAACILGGTDELGGASGTGRTLALIEEALGTVRLAELIAEGRRLTRADVVALAIARP